MKLLNNLKYYFSLAFLIIKNIKKISQDHGFFLINLKNGTVFRIRNLMDLWTLGETYLNRDYENHGARLGLRWTIIDIGAAFGDFSVFAAQQSPDNHVIAVEPLPSSLYLLKQNINNNHLKNISIFSGALSSTQTKIPILENKTNYGHSLISSAATKLVDSISLTELFTRYHISRCHLIKCDCEGSEYDIFSGLPAATFKKINRIVMEYHLFTDGSSQKFEKLQIVLKKNNFKLKLSPNPIHSNLGFLYAFK